MNDYDKASRYLVKRLPSAVLPWLLVSPGLRFRAWIDARRVALPDQDELTNDLVAAVEEDGVLEAICLELEAKARADAVTRLLGYVLRVWTEPETEGSFPITCVSGVVLDLTGRSPTKKLALRSKLVPGCGLAFTVFRRSFAGEDAAALIAGAASEQLSPWLLGWAPLMQHGDEAAIIASWRKTVERRLGDGQDRADLGSVALVLATLAGCRTDWERGLKGWNMKTSPFLDEIRDEVRGEERRAFVLRLGRRKFGAAPSKKQQKALNAITDLARLEALGEWLLDVDSWAELLADD
jgi:hypothetical protein